LFNRTLAVNKKENITMRTDDHFTKRRKSRLLHLLAIVALALTFALSSTPAAYAFPPSENQPPVLTPDQPIWYVASVPGPFVATGTFSDPDGDAVEIFSGSESGGVTYDNVEQSCYGCSSGTWTVYGVIFEASGGWITIYARDELGNEGSTQFFVTGETPTNTAPVVTATNASVTVDEGQTAANTGTVSDADGDTVTLSASVGTVVNNNDGTWSWSLATTDGPTGATVTINADDGNGAPSGPPSSTTFDLTVNNVAPTVNAGPDQSVFRNDVVNLSGSWSDPAGAADNPYTWSWDLTGDTLADDSGTANYGDTIVRTTSFAVDGVATLTFSVTDQDGATSSDTVDITVVNRASTANNQAVSTNEDTPLPITLTGGDADNDTLAYTVLTLPAHGVLGGAAPALTYTPDPDYFGPDSFTFKVNDGLADSTIATVNITVNSVNDPVVAVDDTVTTDEDTPVVIDVQGNDSAGPANENQTLTTSAVSDPPHGTAVINPDATVTYTPDLDYTGTDSFDYTVCDSDGSCATATVTVLVAMVNDPPVAVDDSATTTEDTPVTINAVANDSDVDGNLNPASAALVSGPANGTVVHLGNGSFTYTPNANFSGTDSFVYEVCDSDGVCATATVTITVTPSNNAPVCTSVTPSVAVLWPPNHQFEPVTVSGVTDIDGNPITISITSIFQDEPTNGTGDGDTSPDGQGIGSGAAQVRAERKGNGNGRFYHISFSASDGNGGACTGTVKVSVPKNQGKNGAAVDDGALYNSTQP
jgi:hypothetical protein